jgi:predicted CXXCH cytochrome family protein
MSSRARMVRMAVFTAALLAVLSVSSAAFAYDEPNKQPRHDEWGYANHGDIGRDCKECHRPSIDRAKFPDDECTVCHLGFFGGTSLDATFALTIGKGPHGVYSGASDRCDACHTVHSAPAGIKLLPGQTVTSVCYSCHDGTGGGGVYGAIFARTGVQPAGSHRVDTTSAVPGGNASNGDTATMTFKGGIDGTLGCSDCHSPHDSKTVAKWTNQRLRTGPEKPWVVDPGLTESNRLLRQNPGGSTATATVYGSDWCLACHAGRVDAGALHNHPADSQATTTNPSYVPRNYENVALLSSDASTSVTVMGTLATTNRGYLMPYPRTAQQGTRAPICQQCHENSRDVSLGGVGALDPAGSIAKATPYSVTRDSRRSPTRRSTAACSWRRTTTCASTAIRLRDSGSRFQPFRGCASRDRPQLVPL